MHYQLIRSSLWLCGVRGLDCRSVPTALDLCPLFFAHGDASVFLFEGAKSLTNIAV